MSKFNSAICNSRYIYEPCRRPQLRIDEHIISDKNPKTYKHLDKNETCFNNFTFDSFSILNIAQTAYQLKIKGGMYFDWQKHNLNKRVNDLATTLSI